MALLLDQLTPRNTLQVSDVTATNRAFQSHSNDCGGRLGPTLADGGPDLRNLKHPLLQLSLVCVLVSLCSLLVGPASCPTLDAVILTKLLP